MEPAHIAISATPVASIILHQSHVFEVAAHETLSDFLRIGTAANQANPEFLEILHQLSPYIDRPTQRFEIETVLGTPLCTRSSVLDEAVEHIQICEVVSFSRNEWPMQYLIYFFHVTANKNILQWHRAYNMRHQRVLYRVDRPSGVRGCFLT